MILGQRDREVSPAQPERLRVTGGLLLAEREW